MLNKMIRIMKDSDLAQCGMIYAKAFPMEHWGIDWTAENATEISSRFFLNRKDLLGMYMRKMKGYQDVYLHFVRFLEAKRRFTLMRWRCFPNDKGKE